MIDKLAQTSISVPPPSLDPFFMYMYMVGVLGATYMYIVD